MYAHELLFRSGSENLFLGDGEYATKSVIDDCILMYSQDDKGLFFINCTRDALLSHLVTILPSSGTVLEILEHIEHDRELLDCCVALKKLGYRFALDDVSPDESKRKFMEIADFIKIDFLASDVQTRREIYEMARGNEVRFIAEKVESEADVKVARSEGCDLFQGYFFCKPLMVAAPVIPQNCLIYLNLLAALMHSPANLSEIENLVMSDLSICYRLLRLANSALYGLPSSITSIRTALLMVGENEFLKIVTVAMANIAITPHSRAIIRVALERAKYCELLAPLLDEPPSTLYLLGMLSLMDVILGMPMTQVMNLLPLDHRLKGALLGKNNSLRLPLDLMRARELREWSECELLQKKLGITAPNDSRLCMESIIWADRADHIVAEN